MFQVDLGKSFQHLETTSYMAYIRNLQPVTHLKGAGSSGLTTAGEPVWRPMVYILDNNTFSF